MFEFLLPDLGEGIHEAEILKWHVKKNEIIEEDAPLLDVETDKATVTIPSPHGGKVTFLSGKPGDTLQVGQVVAIFSSEGEEAGPVPAVIEEELPEAPAVAEDKKVVEQTKVPVQPSVQGRPVPAAPATRRLARELGIDINIVVPSGPGGRVTAEDVRAFTQDARKPAAAGQETLVSEPQKEETAIADFAAHAASAIPFLDLEPLPDFSEWGQVEKEPFRSIRRKVAHKMVTSSLLIPHVSHMDEADVTLLEEFRLRENKRLGEQEGVHLTLLVFVIKAVTAGLKAAPSFNCSLDPFKEEIIYKKYVNMGIAVDTGKGLIVPVIKGTDCKNMLQISKEITELAHQAREGALDLSSLRGGTFTITNIGPIGGTPLFPIINYPEVAILGLGRVQDKVVVRDGEIVIRKILPLTISFDHRVADGADAARFVKEVANHLEDPNLLLLKT